MKSYYKVWFNRGVERTAGLVVDTERYPIGKTSVETYSRLFPVSEAGKMRVFHRSNLFPTFEAAFAADMDNRGNAYRVEL